MKYHSLQSLVIVGMIAGVALSFTVFALAI